MMINFLHTTNICQISVGCTKTPFQTGLSPVLFYCSSKCRSAISPVNLKEELLLHIDVSINLAQPNYNTIILKCWIKTTNSVKEMGLLHFCEQHRNHSQIFLKLVKISLIVFKALQAQTQMQLIYVLACYCGSCKQHHDFQSCLEFCRK